MKKTLLITGALLALAAGSAFAQGDINIAWSDCAPTGPANNNFACTSNSGADILVASFAAPVDMPQLNGHAGVVDIQVAAAALDNWWHVETGGCRSGRLTGSFDFTAGPFSCNDVWAGAASGGINIGLSGPNRFRVRTVCAVPTVAPATAGTENYVFKLTLGHQQTAGLGNCAGCLDPACIVFNSILITQPAGVGDYTITSGPNQFCMWKNATGVTPGGCPAATPNQKSTWGSVKALYR